MNDLHFVVEIQRLIAPIETPDWVCVFNKRPTKGDVMDAIERSVEEALDPFRDSLDRASAETALNASAVLHQSRWDDWVDYSDCSELSVYTGDYKMGSIRMKGIRFHEIT